MGIISSNNHYFVVHLIQMCAFAEEEKEEAGGRVDGAEEAH